LADFQSHILEYEAQGIAVVAASVDSLQDAMTTVSRHQLAFPVAYGLDGPAVAAQTVAFWEKEKGFLHATGFILTPTGAVAAALYSTGPIGRYVAKEVLGWITFKANQAE